MGDGMLSLYWNNHRATFCHILATLREKERYTDATLACDGKFYPVHKLVLSTCSEYFEKMFEHTPCKHPVIVLKDIKADALEALLNYMYAGYVNVAQNDLARLIKAAETLSIKGLAVPDEPPPGEENKPNQTKSSREERLSPQPKRRRREENGSSQPSNSPPSSPRVSSPFPVDGEHSQSRSRTQSESHRSDRLDPADQPLDHPPTESQTSDVKVHHQVVVDESLVKEEMVETVDNNQGEGLETGIQYGSVGGEGAMDSGGGGEDPSTHMVPNKYDQPVIPGQAQPLADAVAEALAGPSGMQGWLGGSELGGTGAYGGEGYGGDGSQEPHPSAPPHPPPQQRATSETGGRLRSRDAKWSKSLVPPQRAPRIASEADFIPKRPRNLPFHHSKKKSMSKAFYGQGKFSTQASFRYEDKMWYSQLLRQLSGSSMMPQGFYKKPATSWNSRNIGPVAMISRSRCSPAWTQEKRQQMETNLGQDEPGTNNYDESAPVFRIPKPPVKLDKDDPPKENVKPEDEGEDDGGPSLKNSLEESLKQSPIYNLDWLKALREKYEIRAKTSDCDVAVLAETQRLVEERRRKSQASMDSCMARRMRHLDLQAQSEEEEEYEDDLVPLTPEMEDIIDSAFQKGPPNEVIIDKFNTQITRHDVSTLSGLNWLNDEVINFYMNLLIERGKNDNYPSVYAFNTFFYPKLIKTGYSSVRRWTRKVDLFSHDIILVPIHLGMHWCLATIDLRAKLVRYYDSMLGDNNRCLDALLKYLQDEHQDKKSTPLDMTGWQSENVKDIPQQMNGSDCGMFACMFAEYLSRDAPITFDQQHMPYFRRKMVYEIVQATLL